jgi:hypothetical protein
MKPIFVGKDLKVPMLLCFSAVPFPAQVTTPESRIDETDLPERVQHELRRPHPPRIMEAPA